MLTTINPKLPMRNKNITRDFYVRQLGFHTLTGADYDNYLINEKDNIQIHFFLYENLDPQTNYGQVYIRTNQIDQLYKNLLNQKVAIHPAGHLADRPWQQREFSLLDPDNNLLTFGQSL